MGWTKMKSFTIFVVGSLFLVLLSNFVSCSNDPGKIHGCGGYVRSPFKLEFHQIEIKLFTKQGSLTMKTDCAPTTGYYFIPLDRIGDYVLKISPPEGWTFDPPEYEIKFDGESDMCSKEIDLNFDFKGFSVYGQVVTAGYSEGPNGVKIVLLGPHDLRLETSTESKGVFTFESIPPGQYVVKASHPDLLLENDQYSFEITNKNVKVENKLLVSGYVIAGRVLSDAQAVQGVSLILYGKPGSKIPKNCIANTQNFDVGKNSDESFLCLQNSDSTGKFQFSEVAPGKYNIVPVYRGKNIIYDVSPERLEIEVKHESLTLKKNFQVEGFTVQGIVKGVSGASVSINGKFQAVTNSDGTFSIAKMKPGNYEFQIQSEKFQFDPVKLEVSVANPVLPEFSPSRLLVCGVIKGKQLPESTHPLTLVLQSVDKSGKLSPNIIREAIQDPSNVCVFLPPGSYNAWIDTLPNKYFIPSKLNFQVPSSKEKAFEFSQFLGKISGVINCQLGCPEGVRINLESNGKLIKHLALEDPSNKLKFSFDQLESESYRLSVEANNYCWQNDGAVLIALKDTNIENLSIVQNGFKLKLSSSHEIDLKILSGQTVEKELALKGNQVETICLKTPDIYKLIPSGCHIFEQSEFTVKPGVNTQLELRAIKHLISGSIISKEKIDDLKVKINGELLNGGKPIKEIKVKEGEFQYKVEFGEVSNTVVTLSFLSIGFSFEPAELSVSTVDKCQLNVFRINALKAHIIKGKLVPPLEDVQIKIDLIGDVSESTYVTTDSAGLYVAGPFIHSSGFKVTPTKPGYTFKPLGTDEFSFSVHQLAKINVKVLQDAPGEALTNVLLSLSGPNAYRQNRYTDSQGEMTFTDLQTGQYYLKALLKEFRFEPSAVNIQLEEQETKSVTVKARRESFSLYGQLFSLNGELVPNLLISAKGTGNCAEYGEEGISDELGNFRIWALKSSCTYVISVASGGEAGSKVERTIPASLEITVGQYDIKNVSFLVMTPVTRMDISLRCHSNKEKYLESLEAFIYSARTPDVPAHRISFNGYPFIILPAIPKDGSEYFIAFESSLNEFQYKFKLPNVINFVANESFAHYAFDFNVEPAPVEQDIGKSSYIAMTIVFLAILTSMYFDKLSKLVKLYIENHSGGSGLAARKAKLKSK